jgi:hypothetical protein
MATRPEDFPAPLKGGEQGDRNDTRVGEASHDGERQGHGEKDTPAGSEQQDKDDTKPDGDRR